MLLREDAERCMEARMNGHIAKPIDIEKLGAVILSVLTKRGNLQTGKNNSMNALLDNKEGKNEQNDRKTDRKKR